MGREEAGGKQVAFHASLLVQLLELLCLIRACFHVLNLLKDSWFRKAKRGVWSPSLTCASTTTHAPPRSSPPPGMYTNTGWWYTLSCSTIRLPAWGVGDGGGGWGVYTKMEKV